VSLYDNVSAGCEKICMTDLCGKCDEDMLGKGIMTFMDDETLFTLFPSSPSNNEDHYLLSH